MKRILIFALLWGMSISVSGQEDAAYLDLVRAESQLKSMYDKLYGQAPPGSQLDLFYEIDSVFQSALQLPGAFEYKWTKLDQIGKLASDDGVIKVFSWLYRAKMDAFRYAAFIQVRDKKETTVFRLEPVYSDQIHAIDFDQTVDHWDGKVYYDLVTTQYKRKEFYTLIGADFNNTSTSVKSIEVMSLRRGTPQFLDERFLLNGTVQDRVILKYSADLSATVRYNKELDMIVYDHLVPLHPIYHGNYMFYGPDGSYDGLKFTDGIWVLEEDVDARNQ